jgi:hypothetical protein
MTNLTIEALIEFLYAAESRDADSATEFDLPDPTPDTHDLFVATAEFPDEKYWLICRRHSGKHAYLGHGNDLRYTDCCIFGCPETVRCDCVLSRDAVIAFAAMLPNIGQLTDPWHWVPFEDMYRNE